MSRVEELESLISQLESGQADVTTLKRLALICMENAVVDASSPSLSSGSNPSSPTPFKPVHPSPHLLHQDIWEKNNTFTRFFMALINFLEPTKVRNMYVKIPYICS